RGVGDGVGLAEAAQGEAFDHRFLPGLAIGLPLPLVVRTRAEEPGRYRVHSDAVGAEVTCELTRKSEQRVLGRTIGLDAGQAWPEGGTRRDGDDPSFAAPRHRADSRLQHADRRA